MNVKQAAAMDVAKKMAKDLTNHCAQNQIECLGIIQTPDKERHIPFGVYGLPINAIYALSQVIHGTSMRLGIPQKDVIAAIAKTADRIEEINESATVDRWDGGK